MALNQAAARVTPRLLRYNDAGNIMRRKMGMNYDDEEEDRDGGDDDAYGDELGFSPISNWFVLLEGGLAVMPFQWIRNI